MNIFFSSIINFPRGNYKPAGREAHASGGDRLGGRWLQVARQFLPLRHPLESQTYIMKGPEPVPRLIQQRLFAILAQLWRRVRSAVRAQAARVRSAGLGTSCPAAY